MRPKGATIHYHLIGIAGTAMGSLAGLLRAAGHRVTGSDEGVYPPMSTLLDELGIDYARSFDPSNLVAGGGSGPDVVVVGNAISRGNPELEAVLDRRLRYTSAAQVIREEFLRGRRVLAVAGTHGKTTTSALLAWLLESAGLRPSFLVGGVAENFGTSFRLVDATESDLFVIEADEYDTAYFDKGPKMWHYLPWVAVVNNVEFDHADIFRDDAAYRYAFERFVNLVPGSGTLVAGWDDPVCRALAAASFAPVASFGLGGDASWRAEGIEYGAGGTIFDVYHDGECLGDVVMPLVGAFNVRNCLAAIAAATAAGAGWDGIVEGLRTFRSVARRVEVKGEARGVLVIDDFAHHPTAVAGTLAAVRQRYVERLTGEAGGRLVAAFEPRSYTAQRREHQERYRRALSSADRVVVAGLFHPERYTAETGMDPEALAAAIAADGTPASHIADTDGIVAALAGELRAGDVVVFMSNGGFGGVQEKLLAALGD